MPLTTAQRAFRPGFSSTPRLRCPDCGALPGTPLGHFEYYQTAMRLLPCPDCGLWWVDRLLDRATLDAHFELVYKEEDGYFTKRRAPIYAHLAGWISQVTPLGGSVLDVGGAEGHLLSALRQIRPDSRSLLTDCSGVAVSAARAQGFPAEQRAADELAGLGPFDTVVLSDVLYYLPDLVGFWAALLQLLKPGGALVLRVPNKDWLIRWLGCSPKAFNPEHLYVLTARYLESRLSRLGFSLQHDASPVLGGSLLVDSLCRGLSWAGVVVSPSRVLVARDGT